MNSTPSLSLDTRVVASKDQSSCFLASEAVLLSLQSGEYFGLNDVGASIWRLIQQPRSIGELRDELLIEFDGVDEHTCVLEVREFLERMRALGLVEAM